MKDFILFDQFAKGKKQFQVKTNNCVIYTRVSTKEQADNNMSLETQRKMCEQFAQKSKFIIMGCFGGTYESAKTDDRTELIRLMNFCELKRNKIDVVIFYKIDRWARYSLDYGNLRAKLKKHGVIIKSATENIEDTPAGRFLENGSRKILPSEN